MSRAMRIVTFTNLYPSSVQPRHGIFVEQRLRNLVATGNVESRVIAPVPWFPGSSTVFGRYSNFARVPAREERYGIEVTHPRYPVIPKVGMSVAPLLLAEAMKPVFRDLLRSGYDFDLLDAHYLYPDGVAAIMLGRWLQKPVVLTARGTDVNVILKRFIPHRWIIWACDHAEAIATVSNALRDQLVASGVDRGKLEVLRNGVDLELFAPVERSVARDRLGFDGTVLLSVGNLVAWKGHDITIQALVDLPEARLILVGEGPARPALRRLARKLQVDERVAFIAHVPQQELKYYYSAADFLILASLGEGMPNVVLESLACGTRVIATAVGGSKELIQSNVAGLLISDRSPQSLTRAVRDSLARHYERSSTRQYAKQFGWHDIVAAQLRLFEKILS